MEPGAKAVRAQKKKNLVHHMSKDLSSMESKYDFQIDELIAYRCLTWQLNCSFCTTFLHRYFTFVL